MMSLPSHRWCSAGRSECPVVPRDRGSIQFGAMEKENVCKVLILEGGRRLLRQEPVQERLLHHKKPGLASGFKRCLFGKCDPEDTRKLLEDQYQLDQRRFLEKFGFDIEMVENMERSLEFCKENIENGRKCPRKVLKARRKMSFANNNKTQAGLSQQFITDFYQARKNCPLQPTADSKKQPPAQQDAIADL